MKTTRNYWPLGIMAFFGLFFIGMASVIVIAARHRDSLVNPAYYEQELKFQGQIDAANRAQRAGAKLQYDAAKRQLNLLIPLAQLAGKLSGAVTLYRANAPEQDREFPLELQNDGTQVMDLSRLATGPWKVQAEWTADELAYFLEEKIIVTAP